MAVSYTAYFEADDGSLSKDPQDVATLFEAEPNVLSAEVLGSVGESTPVTGSAGRVEIFVTTILDTAWQVLIDEAGFDDSETDMTYDTETGTIPALPFTFLVGTERIEATADSDTVLTIVRGFGGTTAAAHAENAACVFDVAAADLTLAATAVGAKLSSGRPAPA